MCDECVFAEPLLAPICSEAIAHSISSGGKTTLEALSIEPGYWRATNSSETILACYHADACLGGETGASDYCLEGYEGPCRKANDVGIYTALTIGKKCPVVVALVEPFFFFI